jgi:hypothetical protein
LTFLAVSFNESLIKGEQKWRSEDLKNLQKKKKEIYIKDKIFVSTDQIFKFFA